MLVRTDSLGDFLAGWVLRERRGKSLGGPVFSLYDRVCGVAGGTARGTTSRPVVFEVLTRLSISF